MLTARKVAKEQGLEKVGAAPDIFTPENKVLGCRTEE